MRKVIFCIVLSLFINNLVAQQTLSWTVGFSDNLQTSPSEFIPATVPGAVQLDFARDRNYAPYYYAENWKDYLSIVRYNLKI